MTTGGTSSSVGLISGTSTLWQFQLRVLDSFSSTLFVKWSLGYLGGLLRVSLKLWSQTGSFQEPSTALHCLSLLPPSSASSSSPCFHSSVLPVHTGSFCPCHFCGPELCLASFHLTPSSSNAVSSLNFLSASSPLLGANISVFEPCMTFVSFHHLLESVVFGSGSFFRAGRISAVRFVAAVPGHW